MDYLAIAHGIKTAYDGSTVRYNCRWNGTGKALAKEANFKHKYFA